jgi:hypothetical protein
VIRNSFVINESVCKVIGLAQADKALQKFENLVRLTVEDGVSVVAVEVESDTVVGVAINKIQVINPFTLLIQMCSMPKAPTCHIFLSLSRPSPWLQIVYYQPSG